MGISGKLDEFIKQQDKNLAWWLLTCGILFLVCGMVILFRGGIFEFFAGVGSILSGANLGMDGWNLNKQAKEKAKVVSNAG